MNFFTNLNMKKRHKLAALSLLTIGALAFQSCSKDPAPTPDSASFTVINTTPTPGTFNIYVDGNRTNPAALPFGGTLSYFKVSTGDHTIKFTTASSIESIVTKKVTAENTKAYSIILIDKGSNTDFLYITDDLRAPSSGKALLRFINLSPDAPSLDLAVKDVTASLITDKAYKANSTFIEVDAKKYIFQIKDKATGTVKTTLDETELVAGKIYTVISKGLLAPTGTDQAFGGQVILAQ